MNFKAIPFLIQCTDMPSSQLIQILHNWIYTSLLDSYEYNKVSYKEDTL